MKKILLLSVVLLCLGHFSNAQYPLVRIDSIQFVDANKLANDTTVSPKLGDTVRVQGIVTFDPDNSILSTSRKFSYIQIPDTTIVSWKGINLHILNADTAAVRLFDNFERGNIVEVTGVVAEYTGSGPTSTGETQLNVLPIASQVVGFAQPAKATIVSLTDFARFNGTGIDWQPGTGEQYEGMYVQFENVVVVGVSTFSGGRVSWSIQDTRGNRLPTRDASAIMRPPFISSTASTPPNPNAAVFIQQGKVFSHISGVITEVFGTWTGTTNSLSYTISPLDSFDIGPVLASPPVVTEMVNVPAVPESNDNVKIGAFVTDIDGTVSSVTCNFAVGALSTTFTPIAMAMDSVDHYSVAIGTFANGTVVKYFITATDNDLNTVAWPDSLASGSFFKVVDGGITRIAQLQEVNGPAGSSILTGKTITSNLDVGARLMATTKFTDLGLTILQDGTDAYSGIVALSGPNNDFDNWNRGDSVRITAATVQESNGVTQLTNVTATLVEPANGWVTPFVKPNIDSVLSGKLEHTEAWESMLLQFDSVYVISNNPDDPSNFGEFSVHTDSSMAVGLRSDDISPDLFSNGTTGLFNTDSLTDKQFLSYLRGVLTFSFGNWKLLPRNRTDIAGFNTITSVKPLDVEDNRLGKIYPIPSSDFITVEFETAAMDINVVEIFDINGKLIEQFSKKLGEGQHKLVINCASYEEGYYIIRLSSNGRTRVDRFAITR